MMTIDKRIVEEFSMRVSRSSGPGGQHVNKTNTRVEILFIPSESKILEPEQIELLLHKLQGRINKSGEIRVVSQDGRSQIDNKEIAIERMLELLEKGLTVLAKRKKTKPGKAAREKRLHLKRNLSEKKSLRKTPLL